MKAPVAARRSLLFSGGAISPSAIVIYRILRCAKVTWVAEPSGAAPNEAKVHCSFMPSFRCLSRVFPLLSGVLILQLRVLLVSAFLTLRYSPCSFGLVWLISHS